MNRIDKLFLDRKNNIISIYFTAGHPKIDTTVAVIKTLADTGADMIEIGMPFSDPIADGPVIQKSSYTALKNGMNLKILFEQLKDIRAKVNIPLLLMGYLNPVLQYGIDNFCADCRKVGVDGVIIPDLPLDTFTNEYKHVFEKYDLYNIFLITPQTSDDRIKLLDEASKGFLYMVAASSITGIRGGFEKYQEDYFKRVKAMNLKSPTLIGFGISDASTFKKACQNAQGAIIGSAFVKTLEEEGKIEENIKKFVNSIRSAK
jgi:tryptophan synthase alpha chain